MSIMTGRSAELPRVARRKMSPTLFLVLVFAVLAAAECAVAVMDPVDFLQKNEFVAP